MAPESVSVPLPVLFNVNPPVLLLSITLPQVTLLLTVSTVIALPELLSLAEMSWVLDVPYCRVPPPKVMFPLLPSAPDVKFKVPALMFVP